MIEKYPLSRVADAYEQMHSGKVRFRVVLTMAKAQLLHGTDPQIRRLAQEIITDQQLEIELMQRWLKQRQTK